MKIVIGGKSMTRTARFLEEKRSFRYTQLVLEKVSSDEAAKRAKEEIWSFNKKVDNHPFGKLFNSQLRRLENLSCSNEVLNLLMKQKFSVFKIAISLDLAGSDVPFIPVIPRHFRSLSDQLRMLNGKEVGEEMLGHPLQHKDVVEVPLDPYFIFGVTNKKSSKPEPDGIKKQGKSVFALTITELIAAGIHDKIFLDRFNLALASRLVNGSTSSVASLSKYTHGASIGFDSYATNALGKHSSSEYPHCFKRLNPSWEDEAWRKSILAE